MAKVNRQTSQHEMESLTILLQAPRAAPQVETENMPGPGSPASFVRRAELEILHQEPCAGRVLGPVSSAPTLRKEDYSEHHKKEPRAHRGERRGRRPIHCEESDADELDEKAHDQHRSRDGTE